MARVVSLFLPRWPTDRLRRLRPDVAPPADRPLVLAGQRGAKRVIVAADRAALRAGLRPGMVVAKAQAIQPDLAVLPVDEAGDEAALERLARLALRFSPVVAADPPDGLVLDTTGADHLHGGEQAMLEDLLLWMEREGVEACAALAGTWGAAHALARHGRRRIALVQPGGEAAALSPLPVASLRLSGDIARDLARLGLGTVGDLMDRPRAPLALRFGPLLLGRLDQALGRLAEPIEPVEDPETPQVARLFAEPIGAPETIARYTVKLTDALCAVLEERSLGARRLDLLFRRVDDRVEAIRLALARPSRDRARLARLLCERIETIAPGFGIEAMRLCAPSPECLLARQGASLTEPDEAPDLAALADSLANRVGTGRLYRVAPVESDVPERSVRRVGPLSPETGSEGERRNWPRPVRLLARPQPIRTLALLPDHPPAWFVWQGERRKVTRADGPERIYGEWWKRDEERSGVRDYFRVEDERGGRWWIFRSGDGVDAATGSQGWFLHGVFA